MNFRLWIAGSLLIPLAIQPASAEAEVHHRSTQEAQTPTEQQRRQKANDRLVQHERQQLKKFGHMSAEDRLRLRQDVNDAGRDLYRRPMPTRY